VDGAFSVVGLGTSFSGDISIGSYSSSNLFTIEEAVVENFSASAIFGAYGLNSTFTIDEATDFTSSATFGSYSSNNIFEVGPFVVTDEGDGTIAASWTGTLTNITVGGGGSFDGTYTTFHDGTALVNTHLDGVAGRALTILATTGTPTEGQTLTAGAHLVMHAQVAEPTVTIQWQRDGVDISGATGSTYVLQAADVGTNVRPTFIIASAGLTSVTENGTALGPVAASGGPDLWTVTGSTITNVPASSTWAVTGSVIDTVGAN